MLVLGGNNAASQSVSPKSYIVPFQRESAVMDVAVVQSNRIKILSARSKAKFQLASTPEQSETDMYGSWPKLMPV